MPESGAKEPDPRRVLWFRAPMDLGDWSMRASDALERFLDRVAHWLMEAGSPATGACAEALQGLRMSLPEGRTEMVRPRLGLPVLSHWPEAMMRVAAMDAALTGALVRLSPHLSWRQNPNYVRQPPSPEFLDGYGYAPIAGPDGVVPADIAVGVLLLAPEILYPAHAHPAEEVYLVLDPASRWWRKGEDWREGIAGTAIHHPPGLPHAMQAGESPLCAIYVWRGDLATNAELTLQRSPGGER